MTCITLIQEVRLLCLAQLIIL